MSRSTAFGFEALCYSQRISIFQTAASSATRLESVQYDTTSARADDGGDEGTRTSNPYSPNETAVREYGESKGEIWGNQGNFQKSYSNP